MLQIFVSWCSYVFKMVCIILDMDVYHDLLMGGKFLNEKVDIVAPDIYYCRLQLKTDKKLFHEMSYCHRF